jgi:hypothetical protein
MPEKTTPWRGFFFWLIFKMSQLEWDRHPACLLRSAVADFLGPLDPARFAQGHRSHAVNLDRLAYRATGPPLTASFS